MIASTLSTIAFGLLFVAIIIQIIYIFKKGNHIDNFSHYILLLSFILLLINTVIRSVLINFVAVTNTFEALILFSQLILLLLFIYRMIYKEKTIPAILMGGTFLVIVLLAIASSPLTTKDVLPPVPALQSYWLVLHVIFSFIGEAFFAVAFISSIYYLLVKDNEKKKSIDRITYISIGIGYFIYTAGALIFGAIWAQEAWGTYWNWDPKETWALITWLTYTAYLHFRLISKFLKADKYKISAIISIVGFAFTLFTFFGVNYLLSSLHSYT